MNRRLFPAAFRQPAEAEGGEGSKGAQLNAHLEPMPSKQLTGGWRPRACELAGRSLSGPRDGAKPSEKAPVLIAVVLKPPETGTVKEDGLFVCLLACFRAKRTWKRSHPSRCLPSPPGPAQRPRSPRAAGGRGGAAGKEFVFQLLLPSGEITRRGSHQLVELKNAELVSDELANRCG